MNFKSFKESLAFWSTVLGTILGLLGAIQSLNWLTGIGMLMVAASITAVAYARRQHQLLESAAIRIGGRSMDSLNMASLRRRVNRSLVIQQARNLAVIDGEDLRVTWKIGGYCKVPRETAIDFSIDADTNIPFAELDCYAYDLRHDPRRRHPIRPFLIGPDGISKKIAVPFLAPLSPQQPFSILLRCTLPHCMKPGTDYYTATLSFDQDTIEQCETRLRFLHGHPDWVRVYERGSDGSVRLLKDLPRRHTETGVREYVDIGENVPAKAARIYVFFRRDMSQAAAEDLEQRPKAA